MIADKESASRTSARRIRDKTFDEIVIRDALVNEAPAIAQDRDRAGLALIDRMNDCSPCPVGVRYPRDRHPGSGIWNVGCEITADTLGHSHAVADIARGGKRYVLVGQGGVSVNPRTSLHIVSKSAARQHDPSPRFDPDLVAVAVNDGARNSAIFQDKFIGG